MTVKKSTLIALPLVALFMAGCQTAGVYGNDNAQPQKNLCKIGQTFHECCDELRQQKKPYWILEQKGCVQREGGGSDQNGPSTGGSEGGNNGGNTGGNTGGNEGVGGNDSTGPGSGAGTGGGNTGGNTGNDSTGTGSGGSNNDGGGQNNDGGGRGGERGGGPTAMLTRAQPVFA
jgi:hypothetical protein